MLDRSRAASSPAWARAVAPFVGAALAIAAAIYLMVSGIDYARDGCGCDEPWYPEWLWIITLALAAACFLVALALLRRGLKAWRAQIENQEPNTEH